MGTSDPINETELGLNGRCLMKILKGLFAIVLIGVIAGFVMSLIAPQMDFASVDLGDDEDLF